MRASRGQLRAVIDLGQDLDVVGAIALTLRGRLAEMPGQVAQVFRTKFDRHSAPSRRLARGHPDNTPAR